MLRKLFLSLDALCGPARWTIFGGLVPALLLMAAAVFLYLSPALSYRTLVLSRQICQTAVTLFSEGMVLGLFLDIVLSRR